MSQLFTVLGGAGFIGQRLAHELHRKKARLWVPMRQSPEIFERPLGTVFYCIGLTQDYADRPFETIRAHVGYLAKILEQGNYEHIIYLSSTRLYDGLDAESCNGNTPLKLSPKNTRHLYDLSKALGENLCLTTAPNRSSIARLSCVYDTAPGSPGYLSDLLFRLRHERTLTLDSSPGYCRDYIALDDAVSSLIAIGERRACDIFNVASGANTFNQDIADTLRPLGVDISFNRRDAPMHLARCDIDNLRLLGVSPTKTLVSIETIARSITHG